MVIDHFFSKKPKNCALCKQERDWKELHSFEGRFVCGDCLRLIREEGIVFPADPNSKPELAIEAQRATDLLKGKVISTVWWHRPGELVIQCTDGTRLFVEQSSNQLEISIT